MGYILVLQNHNCPFSGVVICFSAVCAFHQRPKLCKLQQNHILLHSLPSVSSQVPVLQNPIAYTSVSSCASTLLLCTCDTLKVIGIIDNFNRVTCLLLPLLWRHTIHLLLAKTGPGNLALSQLILCCTHPSDCNAVLTVSYLPFKYYSLVFIFALMQLGKRQSTVSIYFIVSSCLALLYQYCYNCPKPMTNV